MKRNLLERMVASIGDSFRRTVALFIRIETWVVMALLTVFGVLIFYAVDFALRTDSLLHFLGHKAALCREPGDLSIFLMFCGAFFFALATVAMFGEITQYLDLRNRSAHYETRSALIGALGWGGFALTLGLGLLYLLGSLCF